MRLRYWGSLTRHYGYLLSESTYFVDLAISKDPTGTIRKSQKDALFKKICVFSKLLRCFLCVIQLI